MASTIVTFTLGDREVEVMVRPMTTLQSVLRNQLGLTATKEGCRQGGCGAARSSSTASRCCPASCRSRTSPVGA